MLIWSKANLFFDSFSGTFGLKTLALLLLRPVQHSQQQISHTRFVSLTKLRVSMVTLVLAKGAVVVVVAGSSVGVRGRRERGKPITVGYSDMRMRSGVTTDNRTGGFQPELRCTFF